MKLPKINIDDNKLNINLKFYTFLKLLLKAQLSHDRICDILIVCSDYQTISNIDPIKNNIINIFHRNTKRDQNIKEYLHNMFQYINDSDDLYLFIFSIKLISMKSLLLAEAKIKEISNTEKLKNIHPLSLEYDKITILKPYQNRVNGALLSLSFFDSLETGFISQSTDDFIRKLSEESLYLKSLGIESNQIFMIIFNEVINQSIKSEGGNDYENRIYQVLSNSGIPPESISKKHDERDSSTEFDFFFTINNKTYGISAKKTLRERYKQFIKTSQMSDLDVMIQVTLGTDLTEEKARSIVQHGVFLFVSDEIYQSSSYFQSEANIFSCIDLNLQTLKDLAKK